MVFKGKKGGGSVRCISGVDFIVGSYITAGASEVWKQ